MEEIAIPRTPRWQPLPLPPGINFVFQFPPEIAACFGQAGNAQQEATKNALEFVQSNLRNVCEVVQAQGQWLEGLKPVVSKHEAWEPHLISLQHEVKGMDHSVQKELQALKMAHKGFEKNQETIIERLTEMEDRISEWIQFSKACQKEVGDVQQARVGDFERVSGEISHLGNASAELQATVGILQAELEALKRQMSSHVAHPPVSEEQIVGICQSAVQNVCGDFVQHWGGEQKKFEAKVARERDLLVTGRSLPGKPADSMRWSTNSFGGRRRRILRWQIPSMAMGGVGKSPPEKTRHDRPQTGGEMANFFPRQFCQARLSPL